MQKNINIAQNVGDQKASKKVKSKIIQAQKCNASFFGDIDTRISPDLLSYFRCPVNDFNIHLVGALSSGTSSMVGIAGVQLCE
jgi:hypothetical protein